MKIIINSGRDNGEGSQEYCLVVPEELKNLPQDVQDELLDAVTRLLDGVDPIMSSPNEHWQVWDNSSRNSDNEFVHRIEMYRQIPGQDNKVVMILHTTTSSSEAHLVCSILDDAFSAFYAGDDMLGRDIIE